MCISSRYVTLNNSMNSCSKRRLNKCKEDTRLPAILINIPVITLFLSITVLFVFHLVMVLEENIYILQARSNPNKTINQQDANLRWQPIHYLYNLSAILFFFCATALEPQKTYTTNSIILFAYSIKKLKQGNPSPWQRPYIAANR